MITSVMHLGREDHIVANRRMKALALGLVLMMGTPILAACEDNNKQQSATGYQQDQGMSQDQPQQVDDQTCFTQMTPDQEQQLQEYVAKNGDNTSSTDNGDGTQTICVLEQSGDGSYEAHYYAEQDHFSDYLLYAMLTGQSRTLATYGLLSGDLDFGQALALQLLTGMSQNGSLYRPYTHTGGHWSRHHTTINNVRVTRVQYGHRSPVRYSANILRNAPAGYSPSYTRLPQATRSSGTVNHGTVTPRRNTQPSTAPSTANPATVTPRRPAAPAPAPRNQQQTQPRQSAAPAAPAPAPAPRKRH